MEDNLEVLYFSNSNGIGILYYFSNALNIKFL